MRTCMEDRIRAAVTGLRNLPLHSTAQNRVWLEIVQLSLDLLAWMPMLTLTGQARPSEPRRLCFRLLFAAGRLVTTGRSRMLRLAAPWPRNSGTRRDTRADGMPSISHRKRNSPPTPPTDPHARSRLRTAITLC
jgi:hypothetical protein